VRWERVYRAKNHDYDCPCQDCVRAPEPQERAGHPFERHTGDERFCTHAGKCHTVMSDGLCSLPESQHPAHVGESGETRAGEGRG
jgi:hypothetical protein